MDINTLTFDETTNEDEYRRTRNSRYLSLGLFRRQSSNVKAEETNRASSPEEAQAVPADTPSSSMQRETDSTVNDPPCLPRGRKVAMCAVLCFGAFLTPLSSMMLTPALPMVAEDLDVHSEIVKPFLNSVQILGTGLGCYLAAPLSDRYGRMPVIHGINLCFIGWNLGCAHAKDVASFLVFRGLVGLMGTGRGSVVVGVIAEIFESRPRARAIALLQMSIQVAPVIGPTIGGVLAEKLGWHWVFYLLVILGFATTAGCLVFLVETNRTVLERQRLRSVGEKSPRPSLIAALRRPCVLLFTVPVISLATCALTLAHGLFYLVMSSLPFTFSSIYGLSASQTGYVMMAPAVGMVLGSVLPDVLVNRLNKTGKGQTDEVPKPERRLTLKLLVPATIFFTGGLLLYGWAAELRFHIAVTITGLFLFALGLAWLGYCSTTYLIDCYPRLAATTTALGYLLGSILNGLLPLAGLGLFNKAGMGRGSTILAVLSLVSSFMFIVCRAMGEHLRERFGPDR